MLNVGPLELLTIAALALVVLGPDRLPGVLRQVGRAIGELRRISGGFQDELRRAMDETLDEREDPPSLPPLAETPTTPATPATPVTDPPPAEPPPVIAPEEAAGLDLPHERDDGEDASDDIEPDIEPERTPATTPEPGPTPEPTPEAVVPEAAVPTSSGTEADDEPAPVSDDPAAEPNSEKPETPA